MITKAKMTQYLTTDGKSFDNLHDAKIQELILLSGLTDGAAGVSMTAFAEQIAAKPREAIAILKVGLPRKPRTVKAKAVKTRKVHLSNRVQVDDDPPRVRTATEIANQKS